MQYIKFTYVDIQTGISIAKQPAANGPVFPAVEGLEYVWARESRYPTDVPEFFGTCPDDADTLVDGVLGVYLQADWETMREDEMRARNPVPPPPTSVTARQGYIYLHREGLLEHIEAYINNLPEPEQTEARIEWEKTSVIERDNPLLAQIAEMMQWDDERLDEMFTEASKL